MPDLSAIRVREDAVDVRWVLFIDGIPYAFTTDAGTGGLGSLLGSGASSWIGLSEAAIGGVEDVGARRVLPGLEMPSTVPLAVDPKSGDWEPNPVTFRLHDLDGVLATLFAPEGKDFDILRQRIAPGTSATAATLLGQGGVTIDIWDRHVGLERIGPAGERRMFPCLPYSLVGMDHAVHQDQNPLDGLPPIKVSDDPIAWAGRMVTLYEVYRDPDSTATTAAAWPTWDLQEAAGNRAWVGKIIGVDRIRGGVIDLRCHGPDGLIRKQLGVVSSNRWQRVTAELNLTAGVDDQIAVYWRARFANVNENGDFDGSIFDNANALTSTNQVDLVAEIEGIIQDAYDGTDTNYSGTKGTLNAWSETAVDQNADTHIYTDGITVKKEDVAADQSILIFWLVLHARVWRQLGYEPETQHFDVKNDGSNDERHIYFQKLTAGHNVGQGLTDWSDTGVEIPADGYWAGRFTTVKLGETEDPASSNEWDNDGKVRHWRPKFPGEPFTIDLQGGQILRLGEGISPYIEGDLTVEHSGADVDGNASTRARYFALRGKVQRVDAEVEDTIQVVKCEWDEANYGAISPGNGALPAVRVVKFMDPRIFGFNHRTLEGLSYWTGTGGGEGAIEAVPLNCYAYTDSDKPEFASSIWSQVLLSTGSSSGWSGGAHTDGANAPTDVYLDIRYWGSDVTLGDLGCGVPYQLVVSQSEINEAFNSVPGGWGGNFNRVRFAHVGPFLAQDVFLSIMRPRRLMWSWHGGQYGVIKLGPFSPSSADVVINEADLYPRDPNDPTSLIPEQMPNPVGQLDAAILRYGWDPESGRTTEQRTARARDAGATHRTGELEEEMSDLGLVPYSEWGPWSVFASPAYYWDSAFEQVWAVDASEFFGQEHYSLDLNVSRPKGQDCRPGTRVVVSNPWPLDSAGARGITNHVGIVYGVEINTATHARSCRVFVFAGQAAGLKHFAGSLRIIEQSGATLTVDDDQYGHGNASLPDTRVLTEPWWSSAGGSMRFRILTRVGDNYTLGATAYTVTGFNSSTNEVTLNSAPPSTDRDADRWLWPAPYADQGAGEFPRVIFGAVVKDDLTHGTGGGVTAGRPFHS